MATDQLKALAGQTNGGLQPEVPSMPLAKIKSIEYFRVKPRSAMIKGIMAGVKQPSKVIRRPLKVHLMRL